MLNIAVKSKRDINLRFKPSETFISSRPSRLRGSIRSLIPTQVLF
ncbi:hypothetical protein AVDCRST_MAG84-1202 [uncultured Microcoleus sp.]|uniref:Uncharacterized protein n=1 Tax=uncultured Microcoleus sp. TaxID=259945 RepID=A0A6J4L108_9CYAN|nr:hypothetical protein AVDCRST_MAG84-1202 [uncultured Microcoleus sp.]